MDTDDGTCDRMDPKICQVDIGDRTGDRIDSGVHQVDRQTLHLHRMVGARSRQPISPSLAQFLAQLRITNCNFGVWHMPSSAQHPASV